MTLHDLQRNSRVLPEYWGESMLVTNMGVMGQSIIGIYEGCHNSQLYIQLQGYQYSSLQILQRGLH
jgi:hypothetical protein